MNEPYRWNLWNFAQLSFTQQTVAKVTKYEIKIIILFYIEGVKYWNIFFVQEYID